MQAGETPMMMAASLGDTNIAKLLQDAVGKMCKEGKFSRISACHRLS
jgi:hypothetical protein